MPSGYEISPKEAEKQWNAEGRAVLIDVREPEEFAVARVPRAELIPMRSIPAELQRLEALADEHDLLILCHHGVRSLQVVHWLRQQGLENCYSVAGGIDLWSCQVDPGVPRY